MSTPMDLNIDDLKALASIIKDAGIRSVQIDPAKVNTPGIWLRVIGLDLTELAALTVRLEVVCVVPDTDYVRAADSLALLFNLVHPVLNAVGGISGAPYFSTLILPGSPAGVPALHIPFDLLTTQE